MGYGRLKAIGQGLSLSMSYAALFVGAWFESVDQWYLPAGLRFGALFLLPRRWIPYAMLGDALAMLYIRVPLANATPAEYPVHWAWISPFLLAASLYGSSRVIQRFLNVSDLRRALLSAAWSFALAAKVMTVAVNLVLWGPSFGTNAQQLISSIIGDYLGIMLVILPWGVWKYRDRWYAPAADVLKQTAVAAGLVAALYGAVVMTGAYGTAVQLLPLICMTLPAVYLTVLFGWNGAAVGCVIVDLGIGLALPETNVLGAFDGTVLLAQTALSVVSVVLLGVGGHITRLSNQFSAAFTKLESERAALSRTKGLARSAMNSAEERLRQQALLLASTRLDLDGFRHYVVSRLKAGGQFRDAYDATLRGRAAIDEIARREGALYPFEIESYGLYAVLMSDDFASRWGPGVKVRNLFVGDSPKDLGIAQRLAVYRGICAAMEVVCRNQEPREITTKVRVWKRGRLVGTTVEIRYRGGIRQHGCTAELESIVMAYGGTVKCRHTRGIAFILSEEPPAATPEDAGVIMAPHPLAR